MKSFKEARRIVVKVGTSTLTYETGRMNIRRIEQLCKVLADLKNSGREILLVSSGAIAAVLGAYAVLFPTHRVLGLIGWFLLPVPAFVFLAFWFVGQFGLGGTNVAWEAHVGGFLFGLVVAALFRGRLLRRVSAAH